MARLAWGLADLQWQFLLFQNLIGLLERTVRV